MTRSSSIAELWNLVAHRSDDLVLSRARRVHPTQRERAVISQATAAAEAVNEDALAILSRAEREQLLRTLQRLVDHLPTESPRRPDPARLWRRRC